MQDRDVKAEDILNAPSLSLSLKTATDASAILKDGYSFLKSDEKQAKQSDEKGIGRIIDKACDISIIEPSKMRDVKI